MFKQKFSFATRLASLILFCSLQMWVTSCQKEQALGVEDNISTELNPVVETFYSTLSSIIKASTIDEMMTKAMATENATRTAEFYLEHEDEYPVHAKLATVDIELEDGSFVTYFDLPADQQVQFVDDYTEYQAQLLNEKIVEIPPLEKYVKEQNRVIKDYLESELMLTKSGEIQIYDSKAFFAGLSSRLNEMAVNFEYDNIIEPSTKGASWTFKGDYTVPYERAKSLMAGVAKRGDIIVALPCHNYPKSLIDFDNKKYKVGHAEVFTKDVTASVGKNDAVTIGAWIDDGVSRLTFENWCYYSYVMGVCNYKIKWKWRGFKSGFYPVKTPVSNPSLLATWAEKYEGNEYVKWYEFATPKWVAPDRFTCTTLVWWCAKKAYGVKISPWYSTLVTPSDVLCDHNTYLKVEITK